MCVLCVHVYVYMCVVCVHDVCCVYMCIVCMLRVKRVTEKVCMHVCCVCTCVCMYMYVTFKKSDGKGVCAYVGCAYEGCVYV